MSKFQVIYADPPWRFRNWSMSELAKRGEKWARQNGRSPYPVMSTEDICKMPVGKLASKNAVALIWATHPKLADGLRVMAAWGFEFKTVAFTWVKTNPSGVGWHFGLGYHTRQNPEIVLLGTKGKGLARVDNTIPNLLIFPRGEHSRKPPITYDRIEALYGDVSRIELFARNTRPGWDAWGNEVDCSPGATVLENYLSPPASQIIDNDDTLPALRGNGKVYVDPGQQMQMEL